MSRFYIRRLEGYDDDIPLPQYATPGAAGLDLRANFMDREGALLQPLERALIPLGFSMSLDEGFEGQIRARSGLALKHGITLANAIGTIDSDYRGAVGVILINLGAAPYHVQHGDRVAQLVVARATQVHLEEVETLDMTTRGSKGFGSTGVN